MFGLFKRNKEENQRQTREGVKRSQERWFGRIMGLLQSSRLDDAVWDELEEILISADVGVSTTQNIIEDLRSRVDGKQLENPEQVFAHLKESLGRDLENQESPDLWLDEEDAPTPYVILMVGVNGVGKTTSFNRKLRRQAACRFHYKKGPANGRTDNVKGNRPSKVDRPNPMTKPLETGNASQESGHRRPDDDWQNRPRWVIENTRR